MNDYIAINNLLSTAMHAADDERFDDFQACFAPGGELVPGVGVPCPQDRIASLSARYAEHRASLPQPQGGKHLALNRSVKIDGDRATAVSDLVSIMLSPERGWYINASGRYNDTLVRIDGEWLIQRRFVTWYNDLPMNPLDATGASNLKDMIQAASAG